jgi:hypothetical protein
MMKFYYYSQMLDHKGSAEFKSDDDNMKVKLELPEDISRKIRGIIEEYARTQHPALRDEVGTIGTDRQLTSPDNDEADPDIIDVDSEEVTTPTEEDYPF